MYGLTNIFRNKEDREFQKNKENIQKLLKKLKRWNDAFAITILVYIKYLIRLYKNLDHGARDYESTLAKYKEVERELRNFYSYYDKISYDHVDVRMFSNPGLFRRASGEVNARLWFNEASEVSFLPIGFLSDASEMRFDEYRVEARTKPSRGCRHWRIVREVKLLLARSESGELENDVVRENVSRLTGEVEEYIRVVGDWEKRKEEVERRYAEYCKMRRRFRSRGNPSAAIKHYNDDNRPSFNHVVVTEYE